MKQIPDTLCQNYVVGIYFKQHGTHSLLFIKKIT